MKLKDTFLIGSVAVAGLTSCVSESIDAEGKDAGTGSMALNVSVKEPAATRATTEVTNFPVILYNAEGTTVQSWSTVSEVPASYVLSVGNYTVESHTPGTIQKRMTTPYYKGTTDVEIQKDLTTEVDVICKMQNASIKVNYDAEFLSVFTTWSITLDDGSNTALSFTNAEGNTPDIVYWLFEEGEEKLNLQFRATTTDGAVVSATRTLTKDDVERYDDDAKYFGGGDAIVINFTPVESTSGHVTGVTINATVTFTETQETVSLNVTDNGMDDTGTEPGGEVTPPTPGDENAIALTLPAPVTLSADETATADPSSGDVVMNAEKGLKSVSVKVDSSSDEMMEQLAAVADEYAGVDLVNGCEVVGNQNLVAFLAGLGKEITVPSEGDTSYTFPVGQFYLFLGILPGEHNFIMTVTDMQGNKKTGTVKVTITE